MTASTALLLGLENREMTFSSLKHHSKDLFKIFLMEKNMYTVQVSVLYLIVIKYFLRKSLKLEHNVIM